MELFYPLRYNNGEYAKLQTVEGAGGSFSIYWVHQLFAAVSRQKFNPQLLCRLMSKLQILPSAGEE
jgi:hypothetical protein